MTAVDLVQLTRGGRVESVHAGHAVVCDDGGQVVASWGDAEATVYPRSSSKMIQALPLLETGAADDFGLGAPQLALACASHNGAEIHTAPVRRWLDVLGLSDGDLRCGPQTPKDTPASEALVRAGNSPCQYHNNCSGKHAGFLTLAKHLGAGPEYIDPDHPVQKAALDAFEESTGETSPGYGIDGCSAPNYAVSLTGMARAMARFAVAAEGTAMERLRSAMMEYPQLVAGEGRACTELMRALPGQAALKTGAEGFFVAILPEAKLGIALKIKDGTTRAAEAMITALLIKYAGLSADHPAALRRLNAPILNWRGVDTGRIELVSPI